MKITIKKLQSCTVSVNIDRKIHLHKLSEKLNLDCLYEPELFCALRFVKYNPLCVNVFSSGNVVILGLKILEFKEIVQTILDDIISSKFKIFINFINFHI